MLATTVGDPASMQDPICSTATGLRRPPTRTSSGRGSSIHTRLDERAKLAWSSTLRWRRSSVSTARTLTELIRPNASWAGRVGSSGQPVLPMSRLPVYTNSGGPSPRFSKHIRAVDLNLLPVLDALLRHRSATLAARQLDMSQSALSSALGRLRVLLGDELFVRTGRGLSPTAHASALAEPVAEIVERVRDRILQSASFDARSAAREFRLAHSDVGAYVMWPRIVRAVRAQAPGVRLLLCTPRQDEIAAGLAEGQVDLAIGSFPRLPESLFQQRLYDRENVGLVSRGHRLIGRTLTLRQFAAVPQVVVRGTSGIQERIEEALARHGLRRDDCIELPSYLMIPPLLEAGSFLAVVPGQLAEAFARHGHFVSLKLPFPLPPSTIRMHWHRRFNQDAGNRWLRQVIARELGVGRAT